jgi:transcriptional regulator with XRE-family HTH domain
MKSYTEIIRGLREDRDLKQIEIARVLGTTQQHYSKYENGEYEMPIRVLTLLADYYGISTDYILGRTECREGVTGQNKKINADCTVGAAMSDILSLSKAGRAAVLDYISMRKLKEADEKKEKESKEKNGRRK